MTNKLEAASLTLFRGDRCLFDGLDFALTDGSLLLLEGKHGSGKTSLLKAIVGMLEPEAGEIRWNGSPIGRVRQAFAGSLVWLAHRVGFKADLTLVENLQFETVLRPGSDRDFDDVLERLGLARLTKLPLRSLSAGQQRRVGLARMLLSGAPLWLMDEPFTNLDRAGRDLVLDIVAEHLGRGGLCAMAAHQPVEIGVPTERIRL